MCEPLDTADLDPSQKPAVAPIHSQPEPQNLPSRKLSTFGHQSRFRLDWDKHKTIITQLYLVNEYRLEDVKCIMSTQYAFEARCVIPLLILQIPTHCC